MPIIVSVPPRIVAYDSGISSLDGVVPARLASEIATGVRIATTGVLLRKAEMTNAVIVSPPSTRVGLVPTSPPSQLPSASMQPVRSSAAEMTNMQAIVTGAEFDKTPSTSAGVSS